MAIPTSAAGAARAIFQSPDYPLPLPREVLRGVLAPRLASRFRVDDLMRLSSVSKGFFQCCEEWRQAIRDGVAHAEELRPNALSAAISLKELRKSAQRPDWFREENRDNWAEALIQICMRYPRLLGEASSSAKYAALSESQRRGRKGRLLDRPYEGLPEQAESQALQPAPASTQRTKLQHALRSFAMLRRFDVVEFDQQHAHLMLMSLSVAVEEGMEPYIEVYGRIPPRQLMGYLINRSGTYHWEDPYHSVNPDWLDFTATVLDALPQGARAPSLKLMKHAIAHCSLGPTGASIHHAMEGRTWEQPVLSLMNAVMRNVHKLARAEDQIEILKLWMARVPAVVPSLGTALLQNSKQFPAFVAAGLDVSFDGFISLISKQLLHSNPSRTAFLDLVRQALLLDNLPDVVQHNWAVLMLTDGALISGMLPPADDSASEEQASEESATAEQDANARDGCTLS